MRAEIDLRRKGKTLFLLIPPRTIALLAVALLQATAIPAAVPAPQPELQPQPATPANSPPLTPDQARAMVNQVLQTELTSVEDSSHPMQYRLRKSSPRVATTKLLVESREGDVARLVAINDAPLSPEDAKNEDTRLQTLLSDPEMQHKRQERERGDSERAKKIIRALPYAFNYSFAGFAQTSQGPSYRFTFQPNPKFDPQDLEAQVLKGMAGELWIDVAEQRVTRIEGKRLYDVNYGLGILAKLDQGGTLLLEQENVAEHQWRTTHMVLTMNARVFFKIVKLDTTLELSGFTPVAPGLSYQQAIQILKHFR